MELRRSSTTSCAGVPGVCGDPSSSSASSIGAGDSGSTGSSALPESVRYNLRLDEDDGGVETLAMICSALALLDVLAEYISGEFAEKGKSSGFRYTRESLTDLAGFVEYLVKVLRLTA